MRRKPAPPRDQEQPYRRPWSLAGLLDLALTFLTMILFGWLLSILLEWVGMGFGWWDAPRAEHSQQLWETELTWLRDDFATPQAVSRLLHWAQQGAAFLYHWSGLEALVRWLVSDTPSVWPGLDWLRAGLLWIGEYILAAAYITQLVGARLVVALVSLPAFAIVGLMSAIDGLVRRDLRRFGGGMDPGFRYHHLKTFLRPLLWMPILIYLASPWSLHPTWVFAPAALLLGAFIQRTVAGFKKYF